jgi:uncharacterized protein
MDRRRVNIVRMDDESDWTLEVVNDGQTSIVWEDPFPSDTAAYGLPQSRD